jgi:hypothetical protein
MDEQINQTKHEQFILCGRAEWKIQGGETL